VPTDPVSPRTVLSIAGGLLAGLVLGVAMAFGSQVLDPRLRREEQLRRLYRLPILARVPIEKRRVRGGPLGPRQVSSAVAEAYRTLRGTLASARGRWRHSSRAILVTGASQGEGKTTTAINLAASLALAGNHVILIEADLRRPAIGPAVGINPERGVVSVLLENSRLEDALVTSDAYGPNFGFLLADHEGGWISELFSLPTAERLIEDARRLADYVVIDSPPLTEVIDALPLAQTVDDVLMVVRIGRTRLDKVTRLGELLAESEIRPAGFAVVGTSRPGRSDYAYYADGRSANGRPAETGLFRSPTPADLNR
jgi:capsular exopolysaccharide synthesis family protein